MSVHRWIFIESDGIWVNDSDQLAVSVISMAEARCPAVTAALDCFPRELLAVWYRRYRDRESERVRVS